MQDVIRLRDVVPLCHAALVRAGCDDVNASAVAATIGAAERDGAESHGVFRLPGYVASLRSGKVNGRARPSWEAVAPAVLRIDGDGGFAPLAHLAMVDPLAAMARSQGVAIAAIVDVHHFSALWAEVELLAAEGLVALACTSSRPFVLPAGGTTPVFGTNPVAFAWPRRDAPAMTFDQASSVMARGDLSIAAREGHEIPLGVGVDAEGTPTTDPAAVLAGAMLPFGGYKGASIALLVELLAGPLLGERLSVEAAEHDLADGGPARGGEFVLAIDPNRTSGGTDWRQHAERLFGELVGQPGVRLPGDRRRSRRRADDDAVPVAADVWSLLFPD